MTSATHGTDEAGQELNKLWRNRRVAEGNACARDLLSPHDGWHVLNKHTRGTTLARWRVHAVQPYYPRHLAYGLARILFYNTINAPPLTPGRTVCP